jgi:hypothetical protein
MLLEAEEKRRFRALRKARRRGEVAQIGVVGETASNVEIPCIYNHHLGRSASSAHKRIQAARACRRFPELLPAIAAGDLNLSAVCVLAPVLTADNGSRVLFEAARLPREELKVYVDDLRAEQTPGPSPAWPVTHFQLTLGAAIANESWRASERTPIDPRWIPPPSPPVHIAARTTDSWPRGRGSVGRTLAGPWEPVS